MSPTSYQLLHPAVYLYCFISICSGYSPDELLRRGGLHPAVYLYCFISICSGYSLDELLPNLRDSTPQYILTAYFKFSVSLNRDTKIMYFFSFPKGLTFKN
jgi:hypothetical protein